MTETKLCKNCKHCRPDRWMQILSFGFESPYEFAQCARPNPENVVDGKPSLSYCSIERRDYSPLDTCGPSGKYWEAK